MSQNILNSTRSPTTTSSRSPCAAPRRIAFSQYSFAEKKAILDHRFFLSIRLQREASVEETITSWESEAAAPWRRTKMQRDRYAQVKEIERHKYYLSMQCGHDIGWEPATEDWVDNHAAAWRDWWEQHWWEKQWWEE